MDTLPFSPLLVVTITTPLAPREPYIAVAEASLNTSIVSISLGFKSFIPSEVGIPSMTYKGPLFLFLMELTPLI